MAKKSKIAKQVQRELMVEHYSQKRKELKIKGDYLGLSRLPRNASQTRLRNRDKIDGRSRGYLREFGLSRINFRKLALEGKIPGVRKASW